MTSRVSMPGLITLTATLRRTGCCCSATKTRPMPPSPICSMSLYGPTTVPGCSRIGEGGMGLDRKSTRLNSSHPIISYAVFFLQKKNCRHRLRLQNVDYSNFSQHQSHLSFFVLLHYPVKRRRDLSQLCTMD